MPASELALSEVPPITISCVICADRMRLLTVVPAAKKTVYTYQCANGHQSEYITLNKWPPWFSAL